MKIVQDLVHPTMYRVEWPDGVLSHDFYNKTRAKEHLRVLQEKMECSIQSTMPFKCPRKLTGAFK